MKVLLILLTILKVIGIIIAAIAALVLILLALVLFVPVRYSAKASYDRKPDISVRISYLLHILSVRFDLHDGNNEFIIKIFGHRIGNRKKKKRRHKVHKKKTAGGVADNEVSVKPVQEKETSDYVYEDDEFSGPETSYKPETDNVRPKKNKKNVFKNIKYKYNNIRGKLGRISQEINDETNRKALKIITESLGKALKHIKPKKHYVNTIFGTGDPCSTGEILGLIYSFAFLSGINIEAIPDFEDKIFKADSYFKGRIRIFTLGIILLKAYRNEDLKKVIHKFTN